MSEYTELFERASERIQAPDLRLDGMHRRRHQKRRNSRLAAGVVGIAIGLVAILAATRGVRTDPRDPVTAPPLRNGEITFIVPGGLGGVTSSGTVQPLLLPCCNPLGGWIQGADWSPDGTRFAYGINARGPDGADDGVYVFDVSSGEARRLTDGPVQSLDWSPDGSAIAYSDFSSILLVGADGSERTRLWKGAGSATYPSWSPDGIEIAFSVDAPSEGGDGATAGTLHVIEPAVSSDRVIVGTTAGLLSAPAWSPDGSAIAFIDRCDIRAIAPDGSRRVRLRHFDDCPSRSLREGGFSDDPKLVWSPDGTQIAFNFFTEDNTFPLYVMNADGTRLNELAAPGGAVPPIAWRPVP